MVSKTDIANKALSLIGGQSIADFDQTESPAASAARLHFEDVLGEILTSAKWRFTLGNRELQPVSEEPLPGFEGVYMLPDDFFRMIEEPIPPENSTGKYSGYERETGEGAGYRVLPSVEGRGPNSMRIHVLRKMTPMTLVYQRTPQANEFPAWFTAVFVIGLASRLCVSVAASSSRASQLYEQFQAQIVRIRAQHAAGAGQASFFARTQPFARDFRLGDGDVLIIPKHDEPLTGQTKAFGYGLNDPALAPFGRGSPHPEYLFEPPQDEADR